jgi:hypothetical protein
MGVHPCVCRLHGDGPQGVVILTYTVVRLGIPSSMEALLVSSGVISLS